MSKDKEESTEIVIAPELAQELAQYADEEAALERPAIGSISTRAGVLSYMDQPMEGNMMELVVVGYSFERAYYSERFDADEVTPPDCAALSLSGNDMAPDQDYGFGTECESCPKNQWRSAVVDGKQGKGKACSERRRLVVVPKDVLTKGVQGCELAMLRVSTTSVKNWATYVNKLKSGLQRPAWSVVTKVWLTPDPKTVFKMNFELVEPIMDAKLIGELRHAHIESELYTMQPFQMEASDTPPSEPLEESDKF